ncbi:MAG: outer membrane lipoprotein carrier protein LolA [Planctomycetia bacterium]|nr:MAG: outer membrane lipoprotein carrier protein LolA [Planctomycetia bacterium]
MTRIKAWAFAGLLVAGMSGAALADTIETVKKAVVDKAEKITSLSFKMTSKMETDAGGMKMKMDSEGTYEWMRKDGKIFSRMESRQKMAMGDQAPQDSKTLMVTDGQFTYIYSEAMGQKSAMKQKADNSQKMFGKEAWDQMEKDYNLALVGNDKVDGHDCWVIEATPKSPQPAGPAKLKMWYAKDTTIGHKTVMLDASGKETMTATMTDVKLDASIPADRFVFTAPSGVEVMDLTGGAGGGASASSEPKADEPKKEEPKKEEPKKDEPKKEEKPGIKLPGLPK